MKRISGSAYIAKRRKRLPLDVAGCLLAIGDDVEVYDRPLELGLVIDVCGERVRVEIDSVVRGYPEVMLPSRALRKIRRSRLAPVRSILPDLIRGIR